MDDNRYYNDAKMKPTINNSLASKLLRLEHKHKYLYVLLNALFDILLKPIPIFVYSLATYNNTSIYKNVIQKVFSFSFIVIGAYLSAIAIYFFILAVIQVIKIFFCPYKYLIIHVRVFDILIKLGEKKLYTSEDYELLEEHKCNIEARNHKISDGQQRAYENKQAKQEEKLKFRKEEYERNKERVEDYCDSAAAGYESARRGDGIFTTAEEKRKQASRDLNNANWYSQMAEEEKRSIESLERKLRQ